MSGPDGDRARSQDDDARGGAGRVAEHAERIAEDVAGQVTGWLARALTRAREEAEDIWAEAQDRRRRW